VTPGPPPRVLHFVHTCTDCGASTHTVQSSGSVSLCLYGLSSLKSSHADCGCAPPLNVSDKSTTARAHSRRTPAPHTASQIESQEQTNKSRALADR
jgi:hypothetical protein